MYSFYHHAPIYECLKNQVLYVIFIDVFFEREGSKRGVPWILGLAPGILDQTCNFGLISLIKAKLPIRELPPIKRGSVLILHFWIQP